MFGKETLKFKDEKGIDNTQIVIRSKYYKLFHLLLFYQYRSVLKEYKLITKDFKPDLIHSNVLYPASIIGYKLSKTFNLPHVITEHWSKVNKFMAKSLYAALGKKAYKHAEAVTVVSDHLKRSISKYVNASTTAIVPNIIDTKLFSFQEKDIDANQLTYTMVAHWLQPKRPDLIFDSLNELAKQVPQKIKLNVVGEGVLLDNLKSRRWLFEVCYLGNKTSQELATLLQRSNYFLHASDMETFSIVIAEALSTGTPVLASHVGAINELINENCGVLCDNTINSWLEGLKKLNHATFDHKAISETTKKYSGEIVGEQFREIYKTILKI